MNKKKHQTGIRVLLFTILIAGCMISCVAAKQYVYPSTLTHAATGNQNEMVKRYDYICQFLKISKYTDQYIFEEQLYNKCLAEKFCKYMLFDAFLLSMFTLLLTIAIKSNRRRFLEKSLSARCLVLINYIHSVDGKSGLHSKNSMLIV